MSSLLSAWHISLDEKHKLLSLISNNYLDIGVIGLLKNNFSLYYVKKITHLYKKDYNFKKLKN
jgi:hypothetical protein